MNSDIFRSFLSPFFFFAWKNACWHSSDWFGKHRLSFTCGFLAIHTLLPVYNMGRKYIKEFPQNLPLIPLFLLGFLIFKQTLWKNKTKTKTETDFMTKKAIKKYHSQGIIPYNPILEYVIKSSIKNFSFQIFMILHTTIKDFYSTLTKTFFA